MVVTLVAAWLLAAAESPEKIFQQATQALAAGKLDTAEQGFRQVLRAEPNHAGALGNLGVVYSRMDRVADAIDVYRRALRIAPNEPGLLLNLGLAYLKLEDYSSAKALLAKVKAR